MDKQSLSHTTWKCQYHIVFIPKYRKKKLFGSVRAEIRKIIKTFCKYKGVEIIEGAVCVDHVLLSAGNKGWDVSGGNDQKERVEYGHNDRTAAIFPNRCADTEFYQSSRIVLCDPACFQQSHCFFRRGMGVQAI